MEMATHNETQTLGSVKRERLRGAVCKGIGGSGYHTAARAILEMSSEIRAAIAQLTCVAGRESSTASGTIPHEGAVCVHLEQAAQNLGRMEELARRLAR